MDTTVTVDRGNGTRLVIHKFGATITSWTVEGQELIFVSPKAVLDGSKAIRGGVPICWPAFGPWSLGSQHGFARSSLWEVTSSSQDSVTLSLAESKAWDEKFLLTFTVRLAETSLEMELTAKNCNPGPDQPIQFTTALHTYFRVEDVEKASISGLTGLEYLDKTEGGARSREEREEVKLTGWTDRVYLNSPDSLTIHGPPGGKILFSKTNLADTVVWNPGEEKASEMGDLGSGNWGGFVCVEAGQCVTPVSLESGQEWTCGHKLQYCKL